MARDFSIVIVKLAVKIDVDVKNKENYAIQNATEVYHAIINQKIINMFTYDLLYFW